MKVWIFHTFGLQTLIRALKIGTLCWGRGEFDPLIDRLSVLDGGGYRRRGRVSFEVELGHPIVTNEDFATRLFPNYFGRYLFSDVDRLDELGGGGEDGSIERLRVAVLRLRGMVREASSLAADLSTSRRHRILLCVDRGRRRQLPQLPAAATVDLKRSPADPSTTLPGQVTRDNSSRRRSSSANITHLSQLS